METIFLPSWDCKDTFQAHCTLLPTNPSMPQALSHIVFWPEHTASNLPHVTLSLPFLSVFVQTVCTACNCSFLLHLQCKITSDPIYVNSLCSLPIALIHTWEQIPVYTHPHLWTEIIDSSLELGLYSHTETYKVCVCVCIIFMNTRHRPYMLHHVYNMNVYYIYVLQWVLKDTSTTTLLSP